MVFWQSHITGFEAMLMVKALAVLSELDPDRLINADLSALHISYGFAKQMQVMDGIVNFCAAMTSPMNLLMYQYHNNANYTRTVMQTVAITYCWVMANQARKRCQ
jgi:hypothetical protein